MNEHEYVELVSAAIDSGLTESERRRLDEYLAGNREARNEYHEMLRVSGLLSDVRHLDPPRRMRESIMQQIRVRQPKESPVSRFARFLKAMGGGRHTGAFPTRAAAIGFAGVALAVVLVVNFSAIDRFVSPDQVSGTLSRRQAPSTVERHIFNEQGVSGEASIGRRADAVEVVVDLKGAAPLAATLYYDLSRLHLRSITGAEPIVPAVGTAGEVRLSLSGEGPAVVTFTEKRAAASEVTLKVQSDGTVLEPVTISTAAPRP